MIDLSLSFASYFCGHVGNATQRYSSTQHIPSQAGVLGVLQVADAASYSVTVLHIGAFQLLIDMWLCQGKELNWRDGGGWPGGLSTHSLLQDSNTLVKGQKSDINLGTDSPPPMTNIW